METNVLQLSSVSTDIRPSRATSEYLRLFPWLSNIVLGTTPLSEAIPHDHPLFVRVSLLKPVHPCLITISTELRDGRGELLADRFHQLRSWYSKIEGSVEIRLRSDYSSNPKRRRRTNTKNQFRNIHSNIHPPSSGRRNVLRGVWLER